MGSQFKKKFAFYMAYGIFKYLYFRHYETGSAILSIHYLFRDSVPKNLCAKFCYNRSSRLVESCEHTNAQTQIFVILRKRILLVSLAHPTHKARSRDPAGNETPRCTSELYQRSSQELILFGPT